jgi:uncharacterized glyoxalase superfamily protein PhnB
VPFPNLTVDNSPSSALYSNGIPRTISAQPDDRILSKMTTDSPNSGTMNRSAHVLAVQNLAAAKEFYERVLGFEDLHVPAPGWCFMERDACRLQIGECPDALPAGDTGDHSYFAYIYVEGATELFAHVQTEGAEILKHLQDESWGMREFALRTPDGHRIMFGEPTIADSA